MKKRLQIPVEDSEFAAIEEIARAKGLTVADWVRQTLRAELAADDEYGTRRKLEAVRAAVRHEFPSGPIEQMLAEVEGFHVPTRIVVSAETFERVVELVRHPRRPTAAMRRLMKGSRP